MNTAGASRRAGVEAVPIAPSSMCSADCRLLALVREGQFLGLAAEDGAAPCAACRAEVGAQLGPQRLTTPLRAQGVQRASGDMEKASWDEAVDRLAFVLGEAVRGQRRVLWLSCGRRPRLSLAFAGRIAAQVPDVTQVVSMPPREVVARLATALIAPDERAAVGDLAAADLVLVWGCDPSDGPHAIDAALAAARARGAVAFVVDPRHTAAVAAGASHVPLRPGTDAPLALGLASAARHAGRPPRSVPALLDAALAGWAPARAAEICGIGGSAMESLCGALAAARSPVIVLGGGAARHAESLAAVQAVALLARLRGARVHAPMPAPDPAAGVLRPVGGGEPRRLPSGGLGAELRTRDPRPDIVVVEGGDPLLEWPGAAELRAHLRRAGLVVVLADAWSPVVGEADLVLPTAALLERADAVGLRDGSVRVGRAALPVRRDALAPSILWRRVAGRLRWPDSWFPQDPNEMLRDAPVPAPPAGMPGRWEPPAWRESGEGPRATPELFRALRLFAVAGTGCSLDPAQPREVSLSPSDAAVRGVSDGCAVLVHNERARVPARVRVVAGQPPGVAGLVEAADPPRRSPTIAELLPAARTPGPVGGEVPGPVLVEVGRTE